MAITARTETTGKIKVLRLTGEDNSKLSSFLKFLSDKYTLDQLKKYMPENSGVTNISLYLKSKEFTRPMFYGKLAKKMLLDWYKLENKK
jgi:hypothetical protein